MPFTFQGHASAATTAESAFIGGAALAESASAATTAAAVLDTFPVLGGDAAVSTTGRADFTGSASFTGTATLRTGGVLAELPFAAAEPELTGTITPPRQVSERERLEGYLKAPFGTPGDAGGGYEQTDYGALVGTFAALAEAVATARNNVLAAHYVNHAGGRALDEIGHGVFTPRREGERDPAYRRRIKAAGRQLVSGGTIDEIVAIAALLLNVPESEVDFEEPFDRRIPARFDIQVGHETLDQASISNEGFLDALRDAKAGGVKLVGTVPGGFTYRSESDFENGVNDQSLAYNEGRYRGLIENYDRWASDDWPDQHGPTLVSNVAEGETASVATGEHGVGYSPLTVSGELSVGGELTVIDKQ